MVLSISRIKLFKACRRAYELKYIEGLRPVQTAEALETGLGFHDMMEQLNKNGCLPDVEDYSKERAMATAYEKYVYPKFHVESSEKWEEYALTRQDKLIGRIDGIADDGRLVEYKTTSQDITDEYEYNLQWDEQLLAYMLMTGAREMYYVVVRKPSIRQKKNESEKEFFDRMVAWYDEDTESKIRLMIVSRTDEEVNEFLSDTGKIVREMNAAECYGHYYRNTAYCKCWGRRCEYSPICLHYDPSQEYVEFVREETKE